jgi:hypothetical protein
MLNYALIALAIAARGELVFAAPVLRDKRRISRRSARGRAFPGLRIRQDG